MIMLTPRCLRCDRTSLLRNTRNCVVSPASLAVAESDHERNTRLKFGKAFPNALLLDGSRLPDLYGSMHFINLTNGLDLAPVLQKLRLPFSVVRIRSTNLEQQAFESLLLELDANLLLQLALGLSCVVWDAGSRSRKTGAPRALWYGLEFIRFALNRSWCKTDHSASHDGPMSRDSSAARKLQLRAHIRGHDVSKDFEAICRSLHPSTKTRIRYYKRFVCAEVQQSGVRLAGAFRRTDRDEDVEHFVKLAQTHCTHPHTLQAAPVSYAVQAGTGPEHMCPSINDSCGAGSHDALEDLGANLMGYQCLVDEGVSLFTAGLSHSEFRHLAAGHDG